MYWSKSSLHEWNGKYFPCLSFSLNLHNRYFYLNLFLYQKNINFMKIQMININIKPSLALLTSYYTNQFLETCSQCLSAKLWKFKWKKNVKTDLSISLDFQYTNFKTSKTFFLIQICFLKIRTQHNHKKLLLEISCIHCVPSSFQYHNALLETQMRYTVYFKKLSYSSINAINLSYISITFLLLHEKHV